MKVRQIEYVEHNFDKDLGFVLDMFEHVPDCNRLSLRLVKNRIDVLLICDIFDSHLCIAFNENYRFINAKFSHENNDNYIKSFNDLITLLQDELILFNKYMRFLQMNL